MSTVQTHRHRSPAASHSPAGAWRIVAAREISAKLHDKNFIMSTLLTMVLLLGGIGFQIWMGSRSDTKTVAVTSAEGRSLAETVGKAMTASDSSQHVTVKQVADQAAAEQAVQDEKADLALVRTPAGWQVDGKDEPGDQFPTYVRQVLSAEVLAQTAAKAGTTPQDIARRTTVTTRALSGKDSGEHITAMILSALFAMLFYMAALTMGMQIAQSVIEEKQSRIVEILASAIPIRQLLAGKVLGNTLMAVGQITLYVTIGLLGVAFTSYKSILSSVAAASAWYIAFFLAGFLAMSCIWAVAGSLATRNEDLQQTTMPLTMILILGFFGSFGATGMVKTVLSFVPVISSMVMPGRLFDGSASWWEGLIALLLTLAFAACSMVLGERMYRRSLMQTSSRMTFRQALRQED